MDTLRICQQCQQPLPENAPEGLCPACLAKVALGSEPAATGGTLDVNPRAGPAAPGARVPPEVTQLAAQFPQLEIIELLGMGGMGMVYKARQPKLDRFVALKILPVDAAAQPTFAERFNREAKALAKLNHPGIVDVYDFGQTGQYYYFIMEYVDGMNLRQLLKSHSLEPRQALELVTQICAALQFAHDEGVVHRDIKPENILLNKKGQVKIADFGLAKLLGTAPDTALTMSQAAMGTLNYMAPEQRENAQKVDHRADIYSLGVVFYEMLTGEVPMGRFEPPSASPRGVQVDVRLDEVVLRALERKPERRYQQASQVKTAVENIASTQPGRAAVAAPFGQILEALLARDYRLEIRSCLRRGWALVKRNFWPLSGVTALILALMAIADSAFTSSYHVANGVTTEGLSILALLLNGPLLAGLFFCFLKRIRGETATVETAFAGFFSKRFLHLFLAHFAVSALTVLGFLCLILPGIYLMVAWSFTLALIIDKGLDFWPAMELSRKIINKHWWKMLLFLIVLGGCWLAGLLCCGVGIFLAAPITLAAFMYAYEDIFGTWTPNAAVSQPIAPVPPAYGPAGTLVVPHAGGAPPPMSSAIPPPPPPPIGAAPSSPAGGQTNQPVRSSRFSFFPVLLLLLLGGLLAMAGVGLAMYKKHWNKLHAPHIFAGQPAAPVAPSPPASIRSAGAFSPGRAGTSDYDRLVNRTRQELEKISVQFDQLQLASSSESNLVVSFKGLRKEPLVETDAAGGGGIRISNEDAVVSISLSKGIQVTDKKSPDHTSISFPGLRIGVNEEQTNSWQNLEGSLVGSRGEGSLWEFAGAGQLAAVRFAMTNLDLANVLAPAETYEVPNPSPPEANADTVKSREKMTDRLAAAEAISDGSIKAKALTVLAEDAAKAGDLEMVKSALGQMGDTEERDAAAHEAALRLAKAGFRKEAIEIARGISDPDLRDRVLADLAQ